MGQNDIKWNAILSIYLSDVIIHSFLWSGGWLNTLANCSITCILSVAAGNVWQLVGVGFPVHRVGEVFAVWCLGHRRAAIVAHSSCRSLDARVLGANARHTRDSSGIRTWTRCLCWAAMVIPLSLSWWVIPILYWRWRIHAHEIAQIGIVCSTITCI